MSLFDAAERFASIDRSQVLLDTKRCLHSQDRYSECAACFSICPVQAIMGGKPPVLNSELCQSCLACLPICPVGAFHADDDIADLLNCATHVEDQVVELLCELHPQPEKGTDADSIGIRIRGCLAGLGTGAYLTLSALGLKRIVARTEACAACKWQTLSPEIRNQTERANHFLSAWGKEDTVTCVDEIEALAERVLWDSKNPPLSRRDLFRMMARQGQVAMARAMEHGVTEAKRQPGRDRLRLLSAVSHLPSTSAQAAVLSEVSRAQRVGGGLDIASNSFESLNFAILTISDSCTACGACGKACPTEALCFQKNEEEMTFSITFSAQSCIGCNVCDHVCLPDAIVLNHTPTFEQVFEAKEPVMAESGTMVRCERCRTFIAQREGVKLCSLCEYRRTHPFDSMMPKKAMKASRI